jgi:hypothetical protein
MELRRASGPLDSTLPGTQEPLGCHAMRLLGRWLETPEIDAFFQREPEG